MTDDPPVLVTVSRSEELLPTATVPNARLAGLAESPPAAAPVPVRLMLSGEVGASEVTVMLPLALPEEVGLNSTLKLVLWLGPNVIGVVAPEMLNPVPLAAICEIVTVDPPVLVRVSESDELLPTVTVPNLRLLGLAVSAPAATPVAERLTVSGELSASETIVTVPLALPADCGAKVTLNVVL